MTRLHLINEWLEVVGNFGVIVGLIFLAFEVQQNTQALDREAQQFAFDVVADSFEGYSEWAQFVVADPELASLWLRGAHGEDLSDVERFRWNTVAGLYWNRLRSNYGQFARLGQDPDGVIEGLLPRRLQEWPAFRVFLRGVYERDPTEPTIRRVAELHPEWFQDG